MIFILLPLITAAFFLLVLKLKELMDDHNTYIQLRQEIVAKGPNFIPKN